MKGRFFAGRRVDAYLYDGRERFKKSGTHEAGEGDEDGDRLERELDGLYDQYQERKSAADAKYRAKKARKEHADDEWEGVSADEKAGSDNDDDESDIEMESGTESDEDEMDVDEKPIVPRVRNLDDNFVDDDELQAALARARREKTMRKPKLLTAEEIARKRT